MNNTRFFNKVFYIQKYYDYVNECVFWRFWFFGYYFDTDKNEINQNKEDE
jgi:hypothetical protein